GSKHSLIQKELGLQVPKKYFWLGSKHSLIQKELGLQVPKKYFWLGSKHSLIQKELGLQVPKKYFWLGSKPHCLHNWILYFGHILLVPKPIRTLKFQQGINYSSLF